uniref:serine/threonine-protein kinase 11-interacting protein isoform X1 n=1 Tax=Vespula vulgaris TaxID=7454 RepID=UPI00223C0B1D|nr:serine/threonine-protein kinase 11-interacting protein isoform X1 [Vespula vulgaris]XP_050864937.1 serine/threonine-protein kinase 11-interacting protein isoform X1 [Vespula vulgaris]XP_050864938.1 serine/threonine-protein kinase 11-interacting protein isoform X1 [Vespula vulgaris]
MSESTSGPQRLSNTPDIMDLVRLLRQNGDKVLSASSKLSLSTTLLYNLNEAFLLIVDDAEDLESSFQVCNSSKIDLFRDLKFLHDFVQKTVGLKLTHYSGNAKVHIDITKFRCLKYLELKKVCIALVKGIQGIRGQLESITCAGRQGVTTVAQLLVTCGGDAGVGFVWASLRHLSLAHNALEKLDRSFELTPWLQILDLSHNLLTSAAELDCLPNLKYVNLGYNKLEMVPVFNKSATHSLQILVLKNNYIEDISGLQGLECLTEIDLSFNCLTEHSVLWPIERMSALLWISLEGNPLSYHPKHRLFSIKHFHPCLIDNKFVLDHWPLSKSEKMLVGDNRVFPIRNIKSSGSRENFVSLSNSATSDNTLSSLDSSISKDFLIKNRGSDISARVEKSFIKNKKKTNVKEAVIAEEDHEKKDSINKSDVSSSSHLETKKQILALREKFGEVNWLSSQAGTFVQDIMGLQSSSSSTIKYHDDTNSISSKDNIDLISSIENKDLDHTNSENVINHIAVNCKDNGNADKVEEMHDNEVLNSELITPLENPANALFDLELEKGDLYLVQNRKNLNEMEELFLELTSDDIKERDTITGKVKYSWSIASVLSCVLGRGETSTVDIIFDTKRKDKQNRRYFIELEDAKKIVSTISEKMSAHPILLKVYKCMKCSTHFSHDEEYAAITYTSATAIKQLKCPTCASTLVIETNELSEMRSENEATSVHNNKYMEMPERVDLQHSESVSSIGAGGTEGGAIFVTTSLVHYDSHPQAQVCCSATSLEESRESTPSISALIKKYESDIEILSNPSQSSIEVLDEASKANLTPNRKKSSEEKSVGIAPSLLTITDAIGPVMVGLTESSSSGSLTDSICTAYENRNVKKCNNNEINTEKELVPATNISTMLGELLQSIKIGSNKSLLIKTEEESSSLNSSVQYSYTDFTSVDHRVKLHIILNVFEYESEELAFLLRADILMHSLKEVFPGCLVLSTSKIYILKINGPEGEDPQRWLHKECSWAIDKLKSIAPLPFKQGILIELEQPTKINEEYVNISFLCILQDFQRTSNFLFYLTDPPLPANCKIEFSVPEHCSTLMHSLLSRIKKDESDDDAVRILALYSSAVLKYHNITTMSQYSGLLVTASTLVILEDNMQWLLPNTKVVPVVLKEQTMSNLMGIEHYDTMLILNFLNEIVGSEETWTLEFNSTGAVEAVINSIQSPWEELFSVPLQITTKSILNSEQS